MTAVRKTQLVRLATWMSLATIAVLCVVFTAYTETGIRRISGLFESEPVRTARAPVPGARSFDAELEARRLNEAVRILAADRDRLLTRLTVLERNLDDVTGSIPANTPSAPRAALAPLPQISAPATIPPQAPPPAAALQPPGRVATGHTAATGTEGPAQSIATKTEFGIDVGGNVSIDGLRALWATLRNNQPALFEGLRPVIAIRDGQKGVELRLIAGPLANANAAARLCAALAAAGQPCQAAVFDGQRLALQ